MTLYFENSCGVRREIARPDSEAEAWRVISNFCKERNFKIYYINQWMTEKGEHFYDVGSHSEFFILI